MAQDNFQEKTEPATPRRRQEAREEGKVARSQETSSLAVLFVGTIALYFFMPGVVAKLKDLCTYLFRNAASFQFTAESISSFLVHIMAAFAVIVAPIIIAVAVAAFLISFIQVGPLLSVKAIEPRLEKINIVKGFGRIFSKRSLFELIRDTVKLAIIGVVGYLAIDSEFKKLIPIADADTIAILSFMGKACFRVALKICLILVIIAALDYAFQKWDYEKSLRMSQQEVKEEMKRYEGSPEIKGRIRRVQRELATARMMQQVPKADVIVTNPTELAVALQYDSETMAAPTVVAKGQRLMAARIKEVAAEGGVPIVENKPLAQALYKAVDIGMTIPSNLYKAVAEVLAYVYRLKGKA